jgi:thymidine phosphorylase
VLRGDPAAPRDLRDRALVLAGALLELGGVAPDGGGIERAAATLESGRALRKFDAIREAQGGAREPPVAPHRHVLHAARAGRVAAIDNRRVARVAKLAGAPASHAAGVEVHVEVGDVLERGQPLLTLHAETPGELAYALDFVRRADGVFRVDEAVG